MSVVEVHRQVTSPHYYPTQPKTGTLAYVSVRSGTARPEHVTQEFLHAGSQVIPVGSSTLISTLRGFT